VTADTGILGSIGVRATYRDTRAQDAARGVRTIEIVSSQSPNKRMDPTEDAGRAQLQLVIDELGAVFVNAVARHMGVDPETVASEFGQGGVFVGQSAVDAGLADRVGTYESVVADLQRGMRPQRRALARAASSITRPSASARGAFSLTEDQTPMADTKQGSPAGEGAAPPAAAPAAAPTSPIAAAPAPVAFDANAIRSEERKRIADIRALGRPGEEQLVQACIDDPACAPAMAAQRLREAENVKLGARLDVVRREATAPAPAGTPSPTPESITPRAAGKAAARALHDLSKRASVQR